MPRTREQIEQAAREAQEWIEGITPDDPDVEFRPAPDLTAMGLAVAAVASTEANLAGTVTAARANGRTWSEIGMVLGVSKQTARNRFGEPAIPRQTSGKTSA